MESFDAYRKWLGIPREEQPPNHYRLLGIGLFESDVDVISNAADRQMAHVRSFQTGRHSELSQQILNELSGARLCLLDPVRKAAYDAELREKLGAGVAVHGGLAGTVPSPPPAAPPPPSSEVGSAPPVQPPAAPRPGVPVVPLGVTSAAQSYNHRRRQRTAWRALASVVIVLLVISLGLIAWAVSTGNWPPGGRSPGDPEAPPGTSGSAGSQATTGQPSGPPGDAAAVPSGMRPPHQRGQSSPASGGPLPIPGLQGAPPPSPGESLAEPVGLKYELRGHRGAVAGVAFSFDSQTVLSGGEDGTLRLWDAIAGGELRQFARKPAPDAQAAADAAPAGSQAAGDDPASAPSQEPRSDQALLPVVQVCFAPPDGQSVLASSAQLNPPSAGVVRAFSVVDGKPTHEIKVAGALVAWDMSVSPDGQRLALACEDSTIALLGFARQGGTTREIHRVAGHDGPVLSVAFSPDGTRLLSGGDDQTVRLWNAETGEEIRPMLGHQGAVRAVGFSPDGLYGVSGGDDGLVWVWDLKDGARLFACKGHTAPVTRVVWAPGGRRILSGSADGTLRLWSTSDGSELSLFQAHNGGVRAVDMAANGRRAVSAGNDGLVSIWNLPDLSLPGQGPEGAEAGEPGRTGPAQPGGARLEVPSADEVTAACERLRTETYAANFQQARQPAAKATLARKLLDHARQQPPPDPAAEYGELILARDLAAECGQVQLALSAVELLGRRFEIDALAETRASLERIAETALPPEARPTLVVESLQLLDEALGAERFDVAEQASSIARDHAARLSDRALTGRVAAAPRRLIEFKQAYEQADQARERLKDNPQDSAAHEAVGRYECLLKGDWPAGLPHLAQGADATLKQLAETELAAPATPAEQIALADGWWEAAERSSGEAQRALKLHAAEWYRRPAPGEPGVDQAKVEQRLAEAGSLESAPQAPRLPAIDDLGCRQGVLKTTLLQHYGGDEQTEAAVERALEWLVRHQQSDGHWSFAHQTPECGDECPHPGTVQDAPKAATALTLLALMGAGHTPQDGSLRKEVNDGLNWLRRHMVYAGPVATAYEPEAQELPGHAWATIVLCETCEVLRDRANSLTAGKAVQFIALTQNTDGGWGDRPAWQGEAADASNLRATAWNLLALAAAQRAGLPVPKRTLDQAKLYVEQGPADRGRGLRRLLGRGNDPLDAALVLLAGHRLGWTDQGADLATLIDQLRASGPATSGAFSANWVHSELLRDCGGTDWKPWNAALRGHLLSTQQTRGHGAGSWFVDTSAWGNREGGRLFCTAVAALTLEVYYRYPPPVDAAGAE